MNQVLLVIVRFFICILKWYLWLRQTDCLSCCFLLFFMKKRRLQPPGPWPCNNQRLEPASAYPQILKFKKTHFWILNLIFIFKKERIESAKESCRKMMLYASTIILNALQILQSNWTLKIEKRTPVIAFLAECVNFIVWFRCDLLAFCSVTLVRYHIDLSVPYCSFTCRFLFIIEKFQKNATPKTTTHIELCGLFVIDSSQLVSELQSEANRSNRFGTAWANLQVVHKIYTTPVYHLQFVIHNLLQFIYSVDAYHRMVQRLYYSRPNFEQLYSVEFCSKFVSAFRLQSRSAFCPPWRLQVAEWFSKFKIQNSQMYNTSAICGIRMDGLGLPAWVRPLQAS